MKKILIFVLLLVINSSVLAHSKLTEISPQDNITYDGVPTRIKMKFNSEVKLIKINLMRINDKEKINLDTSSLGNNSTKYIIPMPQLDIGKYRLQWRALSLDGHIIKGKSDFTVK